jgi:hypothetical protein
MPYTARPMPARLRSLYLDNASRDLCAALGHGGDEGLRMLQRTWPELATALEYFARIYTVPVVDEPPPSRR